MTDPREIKLHSLKAEDILSVLNLDYPGLEEVKRAADAGDRDAALTALLAHYRARFPLPDPAPALDDKTRKEADDAVGHNLQYLGYSPIHYADPIDWEQDPHDDIEWVAGVYRFIWARPLAAAFAATREEKYAQAFVELTTDWIGKHPLEQHERNHRTLPRWRAFAWLDIQTGIRASSLYMAFPILIHAQAFTPQFLGLLLADFYDHLVKVEMLPRSTGIYPSCPNKALMELNGFIEIAAMCPEFRDQPRWLKLGSERLYDTMRQQVTPDGVQREWSTGYHIHVLGDSVGVMEAAQRAGIPPAEDLLVRLHAMYEFLFGLATPELESPMFSDVRRPPFDETPRDKRSFYAPLKKGAALFDEPKYAALADLDLSQLPPNGSFAWEQAGLYTMRNEWGPQQIYFAFHDTPPAISGHDHTDNGTFELYAYGRWLMTDSGYYTYGHDPVARAWHRATAHHQTLTLDGANCQTNARHRLWVNGATFDAVCAENPSYERLTHRRTVWFADRRFLVLLDEAIGEAQGAIDLHYQFAPGPAVVDAAQKRAYTMLHGANVLVWMDADAPVTLEEEEGWMGWDYNKRVARMAMRFRHDSPNAPTHFLTVIVPYIGYQPPSVRARVREGFQAGGDRAEVSVKLAGKRYRLGYDLAARRAWCES